jgi:polyisoprenoid-binding protein YceI
VLVTTTTKTRPAIETGTWVLDPAHTRFGFVARHLMVTKVRGYFDEFEGKVEIADDLTDSSVDISLKAASITTGAKDRDAHLRSGDFLDAEHYEEVRFVSTGIEEVGDTWKVTGDLTIRDVTHPVTLDVTYDGTAADPWGNEHIAFSASARLHREEWDLSWNVALEGGGWLVSKDVTLEIEGQLVRA